MPVLQQEPKAERNSVNTAPITLNTVGIVAVLEQESNAEKVQATKQESKAEGATVTKQKSKIENPTVPKQEFKLASAPATKQVHKVDNISAMPRQTQQVDR